MATRFVAVNDIGRRIGQAHHNAKLTDHEVDRLLAMHAEGWGYRRIARVMEVSRSHVRYVIKGRWRSQTIADYRKVVVREAPPEPVAPPKVVDSPFPTLPNGQA